MFSVDVEDTRYVIEFQHSNPAKTTYNEDSDSFAEDGYIPLSGILIGTECLILAGDKSKTIKDVAINGDPVAQGESYLHPMDRVSRFCKATGRKLSLTRALKVFDKPTRKAFWEVYLTKSRK